MMSKSHVIDPYGSCNPLKSSQKEIITWWSITPPEKLAILVGSCCLRSIRSSGYRGENREGTSLLQSVPGVTPTFLCLKFPEVRIETKFASSITVCCWCIWPRRPRLSFTLLFLVALLLLVPSIATWLAPFFFFFFFFTTTIKVRQQFCHLFNKQYANRIYVTCKGWNGKPYIIWLKILQRGSGNNARRNGKYNFCRGRRNRTNNRNSRRLKVFLRFRIIISIRSKRPVADDALNNPDEAQKLHIQYQNV